MSMGQSDMVSSDLEGRSKEDLEVDRRMTRRHLLRAVAYQAVSLAWPLVASIKKKSECRGMGPLGGDVAGLNWTRMSRSRKPLLGAVFR